MPDLPDEDQEPEADAVTGIDADESENADVITNASLVRQATDEFYEQDE